MFYPKVQQHVECVQKLASVLELHGAQCFRQVDLDGAKQQLTESALLQLFASFAESQATALKVLNTSITNCHAAVGIVCP